MLNKILYDIIRDLESNIPITCKGYIGDEVNGVLQLYRDGKCIKGGVSDSLGNYFYLKKSGKHSFGSSGDSSCATSMKASTSFDLIGVSTGNQNIALAFLNELMRLGEYSNEVVSNAMITINTLDENYDQIFKEENKDKLKKNKNIIRINFSLSYRFNSIDTALCDLNLCEC